MPLYQYSVVNEDEQGVGYLNLADSPIRTGFTASEDESYQSIIHPASLYPTCTPVAIEYEGDIAMQGASSATMCTLAIWSEPNEFPIPGGQLLMGEIIWGDDDSDQNALEIKVQSEPEEYPKKPLFAEVYRIYRECSEQGWDGYGAIPISEEAFFEAMKLIESLPSDFPLPEALPEPSGEIAIEWYEGRKNVFLISVGGKGTISYAGLFGEYNKTYGTEIFSDRIPNIILGQISRLFN